MIAAWFHLQEMRNQKMSEGMLITNRMKYVERISMRSKTENLNLEVRKGKYKRNTGAFIGTVADFCELL